MNGCGWFVRRSAIKKDKNQIAHAGLLYYIDKNWLMQITEVIFSIKNGVLSIT